VKRAKIPEYVAYAVTPSVSRVQLGDGWSMPTEGQVFFLDPSKQMPPLMIVVQVEVEDGKPRPFVAHIAVPTIGVHPDGLEDVWDVEMNLPHMRAKDLRNIAIWLPKLLERAILTLSRQDTEDAGDRAVLVKTVRESLRRPVRRESREQREDEVLKKWETYYKPRRFSQAEAARMEGLSPKTFPSYLSRARKRRDARRAALAVRRRTMARGKK
jgi:hypothetical protein